MGEPLLISLDEAMENEGSNAPQWEQFAKANPREIALLEKFIEHNGLEPRDCLHPLMLAVSSRMSSQEQTVRFTFGFVLVRPDGEKHLIRYFRVQDHLRRMGLARKALIKLFEMSSSAGKKLELGKRPSLSSTLGSREHRQTFEWMFQSFQREEQEKNPHP